MWPCPEQGGPGPGAQDPARPGGFLLVPWSDDGCGGRLAHTWGLPHTRQYLAQSEELGHPEAPHAAVEGGPALLGLGQRHLSPKVPSQQLKGSTGEPGPHPTRQL